MISLLIFLSKVGGGGWGGGRLLALACPDRAFPRLG